jgi:hypothetical protein
MHFLPYIAETQADSQGLFVIDTSQPFTYHFEKVNLSLFIG